VTRRHLVTQAGVEVHTFRATDSSLPALSDGAWPRLLKAGTARHPAAASARAPAGAATTDPSRMVGVEPGGSGGGDGGGDTAPAGAAPAHSAAAFLLAEPGFLDVRVTNPWRHPEPSATPHPSVSGSRVLPCPAAPAAHAGVLL
jgi:hypothetical protein